MRSGTSKTTEECTKAWCVFVWGLNVLPTWFLAGPIPLKISSDPLLPASQISVLVIQLFKLFMVIQYVFWGARMQLELRMHSSMRPLSHFNALFPTISQQRFIHVIQTCSGHNFCASLTSCQLRIGSGTQPSMKPIYPSNCGSQSGFRILCLLLILTAPMRP